MDSSTDWGWVWAAWAFSQPLAQPAGDSNPGGGATGVVCGVTGVLAHPWTQNNFSPSIETPLPFFCLLVPPQPKHVITYYLSVR